MKKDVVINVEGIGKKYTIGTHESYLTLRDRLMELPRKLFKKEKPKEFWALKNVSFEIKSGEVVGIIGRNGAGKSTLLKILARITEPTTGRVTMRGRVASMLEVGTGFNPELTGRENIYLNGAILGMAKKEIETKFEEIVEFSGVDKFLDTPVKHYSSGMYVRLAFAVTAHLDSDILLVDEVLAVGDTDFQKKCIGKMSDLAKSGKTVVFVSHDLSAIKRLCNKTILMDKGNMKLFGDNEKLIKIYLQNSYINKPNFAHRKGDGRIKINRFSIIQNNEKCEIVNVAKPYYFYIYYKSISKFNNVKVSLGINDLYGNRLTTISSNLIHDDFTIKNSSGLLVVKFHDLALVSGKYGITIFISVNGIVSDWIEDFVYFNTDSSSYYNHYITRENQGSILTKFSLYVKE